MRVATWNVNGIRARAAAFERWIHTQRPDILCLQEIKAHPDQIPVHIREIAGYVSYWHGGRGGSSGVSMHVRTATIGIPSFSIPHFDAETRALQGSVGGLTVVNVYTPLGQKSFRQKLEFLEALARYVDALRSDGDRVILCGDLNVAHADQDIHPELFQEDMLCARPEERAKLDTLQALGLADVFRHHHPLERNAYSWWPYYGRARSRNVGWRIDYIFADEMLAAGSRGCRIHKEEASSDHSPVIAEFDSTSISSGQP